MTTEIEYGTTTPKVVKVSLDSSSVYVPFGLKQDDDLGRSVYRPVQFVYIPGTDSIQSQYGPNKAKFAIWNGHEFEVVYGRLQYSSGSYSISFEWAHDPAGPIEYVTHLYYPIDPRVVESDVVGARVAYPNETNTGWLFRHTDEGTHHDYELTLLAAIDGIIQPYFRQLIVDALSSVETTSTRATKRFDLLSQFYGSVVVEARKAARKVFLGEREQKAHPREGWLDRDITNAVAAVKTDWTGKRDKDLREIAQAIRYVETSLAMPSVDTRWDRDARLAKEKSRQNSEQESQE